MLATLRTTTKFNSVRVILFAAILIRIIAAVFSQGFGMFDDHFFVIEPSASWAKGFDYDNWLPWSAKNYGPLGHSFTYVGGHFLYFKGLYSLGIEDPKIQMLIIRLINALGSMIVVWYGIKITQKFSNERLAKMVGWLLALGWMIPFFSVRNLVEMAAIPWLIAGVWLLVRDQNKKFDVLYAGLLIGMAVSIRYQVGVFAVGLAAVYFFKRDWKSFFQVCLGVVITFSLTQGLVDGIIWGYPFAEFLQYFVYNTNDGMDYLPNNNYFMYFIVLTGCFLFPFGLLMLAGFFNSWKKHLIIFLPTLLFILFHTFYPNRQERFVLTVLPFFVILGVIGYDLFKQSRFKERLWKVSFIAYWMLNIPLLCVISTMYSKKSQVEAMYALYPYRNESKTVLMEGTASGRVALKANYYTGDWTLKVVERTDTLTSLSLKEKSKMDYILFFDSKNLKRRINTYKEFYPNMKLIKKSYPSFVDNLIYTINPVNPNEYIEVWKTNCCTTSSRAAS